MQTFSVAHPADLQQPLSQPRFIESEAGFFSVLAASLLTPAAMGFACAAIEISRGDAANIVTGGLTAVAGIAAGVTTSGVYLRDTSQNMKKAVRNAALCVTASAVVLGGPAWVLRHPPGPGQGPQPVRAAAHAPSAPAPR